MKRLLRMFVAAGVAVSAAVVLAVSGAQAAATPGWRYVAVYPVQVMTSVSAFSATDAWAVGVSITGFPGGSLLTSHWNGKKWQTIPQPTALEGGVGPYMTSATVAAVGRGRAWIFVGKVSAYTGDSAVYAVEWTGTSWSAVHQMAYSPGGPIASGPADVWGFESVNGRPWAIHYNGKGWSRVPIWLNVSQASGSAAAGDWVIGTGAAQPKLVRVAHWIKGAWRNVPLPDISVPKGKQLYPGLIAPGPSPASVWATASVGQPWWFYPTTIVLLHWNGKAWSTVPVPKAVTTAGIYALTSDGDGGLWTVSPDVYPSFQVMYHFSGGHWTRVPVPVKSGFVTELDSNMELIPRTGSVLAGATLYGTGFNAAILKYGP